METNPVGKIIAERIAEATSNDEINLVFDELLVDHEYDDFDLYNLLLFDVYREMEGCCNNDRQLVFLQILRPFLVDYCNTKGDSIPEKYLKASLFFYLSDVYTRLDNLSKAEINIDAALTILLEIYEVNMKNIDVIHGISLCFGVKGSINIGQGLYVEAMNFVKRRIGIVEELLKVIEPCDTDRMQSSLAQAYIQYADIVDMNNNADKEPAIIYYMKAKALLELLCVRYPQNFQETESMATVKFRLGLLYMETGRNQEGYSMVVEAHDSWKSLYRKTRRKELKQLVNISKNAINAYHLVVIAQPLQTSVPS